MQVYSMPLSVWGIFVATVLALLAFPALFVSGVMMLLDKTLGTSFFMLLADLGVDVVLVERPRRRRFPGAQRGRSR